MTTIQLSEGFFLFIKKSVKFLRVSELVRSINLALKDTACTVCTIKGDFEYWSSYKTERYNFSTNYTEYI